jgi:tetratricopeptide (TPR) repeat protein
MTCMSSMKLPLRRNHEGMFCAAWRDIHRAVPRLFLMLPLLLLSSLAQAAQNAPYVPASADVVLQTVPPSTDPRVRKFDLLRRDLSRHPHDEGKAVTLAHAYIDYGRATGDARFLGRAMAVIEPWMSEPTPSIPVLLVHATIQQSRHFFQASREELGVILKRAPDNLQAWLTLSTVAMVQGDEVLANSACVHVANTGGDTMGLVCTASLRSLTGQAKQASALLSIVEDSGPTAPPAIKSWIAGLQADTAARMGEADKAETHYRQALQWAPDDNFLLADYADFLLDQHRPNEVIKLLASQTQSDTSFLRLVIAETAVGQPNAASDAAQMSARFAALDARGSYVFRREQARFVLHVSHDPQAALKLAQQNWTVQREPADVRIMLESALAANQPAAAQPVLDFLARTHLSDVVIDPLAARARAQLASPATAATVASTPTRSVP